ncbi:MAG: hypothetical protein R6V10_15390 [bacterium]
MAKTDDFYGKEDIVIENFFTKLKESMESNSSLLDGGRLFLPEYLEGKRFTSSFSPIVHDLADSLQLRCEKEVVNRMPDKKIYDLGDHQRVDFVLGDGGEAIFFLELESLDRAQLCTFWDHEGMKHEDIDNKLWYYYGTIVNYFTLGKEVPRYFVWLLILPDQPVNDEQYKVWDIDYYKLFHPSIKKLICENPFRYYDHLIKTSACLFINKEQDDEHMLFDPRKKDWINKKLADFQSECELVYITCTIKQLILSRGRDNFEPEKETRLDMNWNNN